MVTESSVWEIMFVINETVEQACKWFFFFQKVSEQKCQTEANRILKSFSYFKNSMLGKPGG